ncbi:MAG: SOS response-associated peptidase [Aurantimonas endophytica]|uniref:SOS response-associated peptidase n=1 Tax=Aurantimonas endophytica TaxID=1522175 RepID=UPI003001EB68
MCGRFTLTAPPDAVAELLALIDLDPYPPRYNIAPTQPILIAIGGEAERPGANRPNRRALLARWGLIPGWVKDVKSFPLLINARAETAAEKNAFRGAMRYRRCLVPASGFYEWRRQGKAKSEPHFLKPADGRPFAFAGLMETWHGPDGGEIDTAAILTTAASGRIAAIHDRTPIVVDEADYARWLDCRDYDPAAVADILVPPEDGFFDIVRISDRVNKVANTGPDVQAPLDETAEAPPAAATPSDGEAQGSLF